VSRLFVALARYANDAFRIVQSPHSWSRKFCLWRDLTSLGVGFRDGHVLDYRVESFDREALYFLYREIFARQSYFFEAATARPFILDCGANIGMAVLYFKWLYPDSEVWAFEPEPRTFSTLERNVARNHLTNVRLHNIALWDNDGDLELTVPGNQPGSLLASVSKNRTVGVPVTVRSARLSSFIERQVDFLKIDVEGAELHVLGDLAETGKLSLIRQMVIEYHHNLPDEPPAMSRLIRLLEDCGFSYQVSAWCFPVTTRSQFQDILIGARKEMSRG
jgi:FkbM family methyltransferase